MLKLCVVVFLGRLLDVGIGTMRTIYNVKGKLKLSFICGFIEALLYYYVVRSALLSNITNIIVPLCYSLGYALGSLIGTYITHKVIKV